MGNRVPRQDRDTLEISPVIVLKRKVYPTGRDLSVPGRGRGDVCKPFLVGRSDDGRFRRADHLVLFPGEDSVVFIAYQGGSMFYGRCVGELRLWCNRPPTA